MTGAHTLTVALDADGFTYAFSCPHDGTGADAMPEGTRPVCRDGGDCRGRTALTAAGGPSHAWAGERVTLATVPVQLIDIAGTVYLERAANTPPGPDEAARQLARASGHPRYTDTSASWRRLFEQDANVVHAHREALRRGTPRADAAAWRGVLLAWHQDEARGASAGADLK